MTSNLSETEKWTCIHLSDIHFKHKLPDGLLSEQSDLRNELLRDLRELKKHYPRFDAVLVTGDVAFSGHPDQYTLAKNFLNDVCAAVKLPQEAVWVIPGNHDIDRDVIRNNRSVKRFRDDFKTQSPKDPQKLLDEWLNSNDSDFVVISPLKNYNDFAAQYSAVTTSNSLAWQSDNIRLNDNSSLKIHGINSSLACDDRDARGDGLVVGRQQYIIQREYGTSHLVMCHHPQNWLADGEEMISHFEDRAQVVLFGHEHWARGRRQGEMLLINAGAVHPDGWERHPPTYNIIRIWVEGENVNRHLSVETNRRIYKGGGRGSQFQADFSSTGAERTIERIKLEDWNGPSDDKVSGLISSESGGVEAKMNPTHDPQFKRRLVYSFFTLSTVSRVQVAENLNLINENNKKLNGTELALDIIAEAERQELLSDLWDAVLSEKED